MINTQEVDYPALARLAERIIRSECRQEAITRVMEAEIAVAINLKSQQYGSFRELDEPRSADHIASLYNVDLPRYLTSLDAARDLFKAFHGPLENPFVYTILNDYGGLRRVRIFEPLSGMLVTADGPSEEAALVAATLKLAVQRYKLTEEERNAGKWLP